MPSLYRLYGSDSQPTGSGTGSRFRLYDTPVQEAAPPQQKATPEQTQRLTGSKPIDQSKLMIKNATIKQAPPKKQHFGFLGRFVSKTYETARDIFNDSVDRVVDFVDTLDSEGVPLSYYQSHLAEPGGKSVKQQYLAEGKKPVTPAERVAKATRVATGGVNLLFTPVTAPLAGAEEVPVLKYPVKALNWGFEKLGNAGAFVGTGIVNNMPISEEAKDQLRPAIAELSGLVAQTVVGGKAVHALGKVKAKVALKIAERQADTGGVITPNDAKIITNQVVKEVPAKSPGTVVFQTGEGKVPVVTDQRLVLENFLKGKEDVSYRVVRGLGKDTNGNPVRARFAWDYKNQRATVYVTNKTTAANLAHEIGHYFDRKLSLQIADQFSEIIPDYLTNKQAVKDSLTQYAVDTLDGNASPQQIGTKVRSLATKFSTQVKDLAVASKERRRAPNEQFASAVREVLLKPEESLKTAPEFTSFIQYFSDKQGLLSDAIKQVEPKQPEAAAPTEIAPKTEVKPTSPETAPGGTEVVKTPEQAIQPQKPAPASEKPPKTTPVAGKFAQTGLKTGEVVKDQPAFNLDKINAPEDVTSVIQSVSKASGEFAKQRISKSDENIKAMAQEVGVTPEDLIKLKPGSIANAETVYKSRQLVVDMANDLRQTIKQITTEAATPEQVKDFRNKLLRLQGTMKAVAGLRTEAANTFRQFKIDVTPGENDILTDMISELKRVDAKAGDDLAKFTKAAKELVEPTAADKAWHLWYMSVLSGGSTQIKNIAGNLANMLGETAVEGITNPKGFRNSMAGLYKGLVEGKTLAMKVLREGDIAKLEERGRKPIVFTLGSEKATGLNKVARETGARVLNSADYVGRFMSAMDTWARTGFKGWETRAQAREIALREAKEGTIKPSEVGARTDQLSREPISEMIEATDQFAARGTYTQKPTGVLGWLAETMSKGARKFPAVRLVVPFTRVVANVVNNSLDWTPVGIFRAFAKGEGGERMRPRARNQELGRAVLGTAAMAYVASLAAEGNLSGNGPSDIKKKNQLQDTGWRPNSIKIGDKWYPYSNWGPMAVPFSLVGNYFDYQKYEADADQTAAMRLTAGVLNSVNSILDMSFLSGTADLVTALQNIGKGGEKYFQRFLAQQITSPVPNVVKQTARYFDPTVYQTDNLKQQILSNLRITSGLKPKLNVFGQPVKGEALTQLQPVSTTKDPLIKYLSENNLWVSVPLKSTTIVPAHEKVTIVKGKPVGREMTSDEYYNYVKYSGIEIRKRLTRDLHILKAMNPDERQDYVRKIVNDVRHGVKVGIENGVYD